jgi:hypothetical protein
MGKLKRINTYSRSGDLISTKVIDIDFHQHYIDKAIARGGGAKTLTNAEAEDPENWRQDLEANASKKMLVNGELIKRSKVQLAQKKLDWERKVYDDEEEMQRRIDNDEIEETYPDGEKRNLDWRGRKGMTRQQRKKGRRP